MGFPRQEYWSGLPFPSLGDLLDPGIEPTCLMFPALASRFFTTCTTWEAPSIGIQPGNPTPRHMPKRKESVFPQKAWYRSAVSSSSPNSCRSGNNPSASQLRGGPTKHDGISRNHKMEQSAEACCNTHNPGKYYAKRKKPQLKLHVLPDFNHAKCLIRQIHTERNMNGLGGGIGDWE